MYSANFKLFDDQKHTKNSILLARGLISFTASVNQNSELFNSDEKLGCTSEIVGKTQKLDNGITYCTSGGDWACYFKIEEICEEQNSGNTRSTWSIHFRFL
jgi:hypothetical protein